MFKKDDTFLRHSGKVRGLVPFCKSSYPDMISAEGLRSAGLKEKDKRVYRYVTCLRRSAEKCIFGGEEEAVCSAC